MNAPLLSPPPLDTFISKVTLDALPIPIVVYRCDGLMIGYNQAIEDFWGFSHAPLVGTFNIFESPIFTADILSAFREAASGHVVNLSSGRVDIARSKDLPVKEGAERTSAWLDTTYAPLRDAEGNVAYVLILLRDVTEFVESRKAIEEARGEIAEQRELIARLEVAQREIAEQRDLIVALESPLIEVWEGVLLLPIIGAMSERRAADMMDKALSAVSASRARYLILDLTGSDHIDTNNANHFSNILRAVALLGSQGVIVGIRPQMAQTMASLGLNLAGIRIYRNLREALARCTRDAAGDRRLPR